MYPKHTNERILKEHFNTEECRLIGVHFYANKKKSLFEIIFGNSFCVCVRCFVVQTTIESDGLGFQL
jgi:hypothetical protein